ncbi:MAG: hypothetical protein U1E73_04005 [Planctomycetota bacterium]
MKLPSPFFLSLAALLPGGLTTAQVACGMWAGPVTVTQVPCATPYTFRIVGQGVFSGCCGGPGCWPTVTVRNLRTLHEEWIEVGGCGGHTGTYTATFVANPAFFPLGDPVTFLRGNRSLSNPPSLCENNGPTLTVQDLSPIEPSPTSTQAMSQHDFGDDVVYGVCNQTTIGAKGCALTSAAMILNYHLAKHGIPGHITPDVLNEMLKDPNIGGYRECRKVWWPAVEYIGRSVLGIPGFELVDGGDCDPSPGAMQAVLCREGPIAIETKSLRPGATPEETHWVVVVQATGNTYAIRDPGSGHASLASYDNEIRKCRRFRSSDPSNDASTGDHSTMGIAVDMAAARLAVRDAGEALTGHDPATGMLVAGIPGSNAFTEGGLDSHDVGVGPDEPATILAFAHPPTLLHLTVEPLADGPLRVHLRAETNGEDVVDAELALVGRVQVVTTAAVYFHRGSGGPASRSLHLVDLGQPVMGAQVIVLPGAEPAPATGATRVLYTGVIWPRGVVGAELHQVTMAAGGGNSPAIDPAELRLCADSDGDHEYSAADEVLATAAGFDGEGKVVFDLPGHSLSQPLEFFVIGESPTNTAARPAGMLRAAGRHAELPWLVLAALAIVALAFGVVAVARRRLLEFRCAAVGALLSVLLGACHHHGTESGPATVALRLTVESVQATDGAVVLPVAGLPAAGFEVVLPQR